MTHPFVPLSSDEATAIAQRLKYNADGLVPAIAQQHDSGEILMMAWMNATAVIETLSSARACYYSRSRAKLWRKGESSGQVQTLMDFRWDCDADTVLMMVDQKGVACHTGRRNCFFNAVRNGTAQIIAEVQIDPDKLYG